MADADVIKLMRLLTFMEMDEIRRYEKMMAAADYVPNTAQKRLAEEVTRMMHGEDGLQKALRITQGAAPGSQTVLDPEVLEALSQEMPCYEVARAELIGSKLVIYWLNPVCCPAKARGAGSLRMAEST